MYQKNKNVNKSFHLNTLIPLIEAIADKAGVRPVNRGSCARDQRNPPGAIRRQIYWLAIPGLGCQGSLELPGEPVKRG